MKLFISLFFLSLFSIKNTDIKILVITGGHDFDKKPFLEMFENMEGITYEHVVQPVANQMIQKNKPSSYDVLVFYDMYDSITQAQKKAYLHLLDEKTGMVFLHHSLVSYQGWPEFRKVIGGKYYAQEGTIDGKSYKSTYRHDVNVPITVTGTHPIVQGIDDFTLFDEVYGNCEILNHVTPLLSTTHPESMQHIAWINYYGNSEIIYIQPGHGKDAFVNPVYRKLILQAIQWSAKIHSKNTNNL